jgi:hypothetical protein
MVKFSMGAGLWLEGFSWGFFRAVPKFGSCGGRYALLLNRNGQMSCCQNEAEDEERAMFKEFEDEIEVKGLYAVDEGMPIEFKVKGLVEIEAGMDEIEVKMGWEPWFKSFAMTGEGGSRSWPSVEDWNIGVPVEESVLKLVFFLFHQESQELVELVHIEFELVWAEAEGEFQMS